NKKKKEGEMERIPDGVILFEVDQISNMQAILEKPEKNHIRYSSEIVVVGVRWLAMTSRFPNFFTVYLYCENNQSSNWSIDVNAVFTLVNSDKNKNSMNRKEECLQKDRNLMMAMWYPEQLKWNDLINCEKGFINNDRITIEIRFWIKAKGVKIFPQFNFTDSNDPRHDVTLLIEGEKIYASKAILAANSRFFNSLFYGNFSEKNKEEIELKDVKSDVFHRLNLIYIF
ncbi:hypothetical protein PMAYCL1PPCAC_24789, partial [Pristionchus mayeri]